MTVGEQPDQGVLLTAREAFEAMVCFVNQFAARAAGNDLPTLIGDISLDVWADGGPTDPAAWDDWLECVREVRGRHAE